MMESFCSSKLLTVSQDGSNQRLHKTGYIQVEKYSNECVQLLFIPYLPWLPLVCTLRGCRLILIVSVSIYSIFSANSYDVIFLS